MPRVPPSRRRHLALLLVAAAALVGLAAWLQYTGRFERAVAYFRAAGPGPFFGAMAILPIFGFPIAAFTVAAGPVFGPTLGVTKVIGWAVLAEMVNMTLSYWIAARLLHGWAGRLLQRLGYARPEVPGGAGWELTLVVRIFPGLPFFVQNYLLGFARVPFGSYLVISTLVHAVFVIGAVLAGDAFVRRDPRALVVGGVLVALGFVAVYRLRRRWAKPSARGEGKIPDEAP